MIASPTAELHTIQRSKATMNSSKYSVTWDNGSEVEEIGFRTFPLLVNKLLVEERFDDDDGHEDRFGDDDGDEDGR